MRILDCTAGFRGIWFDKEDPLATFTDIRPEVRPDRVADVRRLPFGDGEFDVVVFDPPHVSVGPKSQMGERYGHHHAEEIREIVARGAQEIWRVLKTDGLMILKWSSHDTPLDKILRLMPSFRPLFGHKVASRLKHRSDTFWVVLIKRAQVLQTQLVSVEANP